MRSRPKQNAAGVSAETFTIGFRTALGVFHGEFSKRGLRHLHFPGGGCQSAPCEAEVPAWVRRAVRETRAALDCAVQGGRPRSMPAIDWSDATPFQQAVWRALLEITPGQTQTYGEVARRIRKPRAARAVGTACGANPIPVLVPCHRVITAGGGLGGFSGGLDWKRRLLAIEAGSQSLS